MKKPQKSKPDPKGFAKLADAIMHPGQDSKRCLANLENPTGSLNYHFFQILAKDGSEILSDKSATKAKELLVDYLKDAPHIIREEAPFTLRLVTKTVIEEVSLPQGLWQKCNE